MSIQTEDVRAIVGRIEKLERQNRQRRVGGFLLLAAALLCGLAAGGQQKPQGKPQGKPPAWQLADGRMVVFPPSVKKVEEVDATALDLPPGTKVIGWEPVEDATSILPDYGPRVATLPTVQDKFNSLAYAANILQNQIDLMKIDIKNAQYAHADLAKVVYQNAEVINMNAAAAMTEIDRLKMEQDGLKRERDSLEQKLNHFKDAVCPILRGADVGWRTKMEIDSACGSH